MTPQGSTPVQVVTQKSSEPRVTRHDVTFQLKVLALHGQPLTEDSRVYQALSLADEDLYAQLPREVADWRYLDNYQIECERLEVCQPEFGHDDALPDNCSVYDITLSASYALPLLRSDCSVDRPVSVEQLVDEVPPLLVAIYQKAGVTLELHKVRYYLTQEFTSQGEYSKS